MPAYFETGALGNGQSAWHGLGTVLPEGQWMTVESVLNDANINWLVNKTQLHLPDGRKCPNAHALVRDSDKSVLAVVGDVYHPFQNYQLRDLAQALSDTGEVKFETAMSLKGGQIVTLLARMESYKVLGDEFKPFINLSNMHGCGSLKAWLTAVRIVCWNTYSASLSEAQRIWSRRHTINSLVMSQQAIADARKMLNLAASQRDQTIKLAEKLVKVPMAAKEYEKLAELLFPMPEATEDKPVTEKQKLLVDEKRSLLFRAAQADDLANFRATAWGALGAVTAYQSHVSQASDTTKEETRRARQENRVLESMEGGALEKLALDFLLSLA